MRQVLINLMNNSLKFTEQGEVVVTVESKVLNGDGEHELHFAVRDTGIGIPTDRMDRLFQSFSQVDASTTRKYGGTGLGLAISKRLAEEMGGTMWAESTGVPGEGSTFHFTVRAEAAPDFETRIHLTGEQPSLAGKRALTVDDNATNRRILNLQLEGWGLVTRDTASPVEALRWIEEGEKFDLAILDLHMDEMDGVTLAKAIRQHKAGKSLPLVLFSSMGQRDPEIETVGFDAHLTKPLKQSALHDTLMTVLGEKVVRARTSATALPDIDVQMAEKLPLRILLAEDNMVNQKLARAAAVRRDPDGCANAGDGWVGGHAGDRAALARGRAPAHHRHDGQCDGGGPRSVLCCRDGRLRCQARSHG